ncbi:unnamed protein product [Calicophoron daubneyi]|uniref:glutathione gamma-glutamylcysteinyltransferase n=1 Tax=Calicophoron daubneyi TaxID=300641 RepID=A0AAV2TDL0_CALDB
MLNGLPKNVLTQGIALDEFAEIARAHGLSVELHHVESHDHVSVFRDLVSEMARTDKRGYLVCCYDRGAMGQSGSGHFAAIGGYHPYQELVFLFDTARFKYPSHWAPLARLWNGMGQVDPVTQKPRGYLVVTRTTTDRSVICCARHGPLQSSSSKLLLFTVSDSTRQAYLSPILHDKTSVGYRLRCVADDWLGWLSGVEQPVSGAMNASLIRQATSVLLDLCDKYRPDYFFLGVQQIADVPNISEPNLQEMQHRILRNLLKSDVGLSVRDVVLTLPGDVLSRLTTDSTFHQSIVKFYSDALSCSKSSVCPFAEVSDPGLRLTLLVTCFLYCFPYVEMCTTTLPPNCSSRSQRMSLVADSANLLQCTQTEIHILRTILCSFISSALKKNDSL